MTDSAVPAQARSEGELRIFSVFRMATAALALFSFWRFYVNYQTWQIRFFPIGSGTDYTFDRFSLLAALAAPAALLCGVAGRLPAISTLLIYGLLNFSNAHVFYGIDQYIMTNLVVLSIFPANQYFSCATRVARSNINADTYWLAGYARLMLQGIFTIRYCASGFHKEIGSVLKGQNYVWNLFNIYELNPADVTVLVHPFYYTLAALIGKYFEMCFGPAYFFAALAALRWPRFAWLQIFLVACGMIMHAVIGWTTTLSAFSLVIISCYLLFIPTVANSRPQAQARLGS